MPHFARIQIELNSVLACNYHWPLCERPDNASLNASKAAARGLMVVVSLQGIELTNPLLQAQQEDAQRSGTESYFSEYSGFRSIKGK